MPFTVQCGDQRMNKTMPPLRQKLREVASEAMLDAAERCMIANGYEQTTMQQIATEAGCAAGTFYLYFKSKEELLRVILGRHSSVMFKMVRKEFDDLDDPLESIKAGTFTFLKHANENRGFYRLFLTALPMRHGQLVKMLPPEAQREQQDFMMLEIEAFREAQRRGLIRSDLPAEFMHNSLVALGFELVERVIYDENPPGIQTQSEMIWRLFSEGIGAKS